MADSGWTEAIRRRVAPLLADRLVRNVGWYGLAEFANRLTRLITTIVLARYLVPQEFGFAAIAMTTFEIVRVLSHTGIGQAVARAPAADLPALCATAYRASWLMALTAFAVQITVGALVLQWTGRSDAFWMIACLAIVYLTQPFGQIQAFLIARANRLHVVAGVGVMQVTADNILTAVLAISGFGAWSIVLPKLMTTPIWVFGMRRAQRWTRDRHAGYAPMGTLLRFAGTVIGSELLVAARMNLDNVLVAGILGVEALGIYYTVFNAGIGFSLSLTSSLAATVYPHLAEVAAQPRALVARYDGLMRRAVLPCAAVIALQAIAALAYVPMVFGERWAPFAYLVAVLCASAITKPLFDSACQLLRVIGKPKVEFAASGALTVISLSALAGALPFGLAPGVIALAATTAVAQLGFAFAVRRGAFALLAGNEEPNTAGAAPDRSRQPSGVTP